MPDAADRDELLKHKTIVLTAFTRTYNATLKLFESEKKENDSLRRSLDSVKTRYGDLEEACNNAKSVFDEKDEQYVALDTLLNEKYNMVFDLECRFDALVNGAIAPIVDPNTSVLSTSEETSDMIKSFKASLTLPKPQFKKFGGNSAEYSNFISYIETYVEDSVTDDRQRLSFLIDSCTKEAYNAISYLSQCKNATQAYKDAKEKLRDFFGKKNQINRAVTDECTNGPHIKGTDINRIQSLVISIDNAITTLRENGCAEELTSTDKLYKIYSRLPQTLKQKWNKTVLDCENKDSRPSFENMSEILKNFIKTNDNEYCSRDHKSKPHDSSSNSKPIFGVDERSKKKRNVSCNYCGEKHPIYRCEKFIQLSLKERGQAVVRKNLCRNCLLAGHSANSCLKRGYCRQCRHKHNNLLHDVNFDQMRNDGAQHGGGAAAGTSSGHTAGNNGSPAASGEVCNSINSVSGCDNTCKPGIACVDIVVEGKHAMYKTKGIIDPKSTVNLCTKRLAEKLNLNSVPISTSFNVATGIYDVNGHKIESTKVYNKDLSDFVIAKNVITMDSILASSDSVFNMSDISGFSHLDDVDVAFVSSGDEIDFLIGSGVPKAFHMYEERKGQDDEIYAVRQTLGWNLVGCKQYNGSGQSNCFLCHDLSPLSDPFEYMHKMYNSDFSDCSLFSEKLCPSADDVQALKLVENSMVLNGGKFCVGFPWKQDPANLPNCKDVILKRLGSLKNRLLRDSDLLNDYANEMQKFIDNDFIELSRSTDTPLQHYIAHHPVFHPRTGALRVVWDCAFTLNDFIFEGPDLMNSLVDVLIRFRRFRYAFCSDIRKMYLKVQVPPSDRGALRIFWWPGGNLSLEPVEYRAKVHIYGAKSSGFIAINCVQTLARCGEDLIVRDVLLKDLYVDDQLSSFDDANVCMDVISGLRGVLSKGDFHLTKFNSNNDFILKDVPEADRADIKESDIDGSGDQQSVLGVKWNTESDCFSFPCKIPPEETVHSRRNI